jgi:hypothetical protein
MPEAPPTDIEQVRYAFRLGWVIAELRGRYRPDRFGKREPGRQDSFQRSDHELPLSNERSLTEIRIELFDAATDLSRELKLAPNDSQGRPLLTQIKPLLEAMEADNADRELIWKGDPNRTSPAKRFFRTRKDEPDRSCLAYCFFKWDAQNQDDLVLNATQAAAYQLGRGLAETYWALHPERPADEMGSWQSVLGPDRRETLLRLAGRLSAYFGPLVLAAIDGSLRAWSTLATSADPTRRNEPEVQPALFRQCLLWRDLIRGERQPGDLLTNEDLNAPETADAWKKLKLYKLAAESLKWPLITGLLGAILLVGGGALLASDTGHTGLTAAVSILGALGLTSAGLYAKAKTQITSLSTNLSQKVKEERVRQAANLCPTAPAKPAAQRTAPGQAERQLTPAPPQTQRPTP